MRQLKFKEDTLGAKYIRLEGYVVQEALLLGRVTI